MEKIPKIDISETPRTTFVKTYFVDLLKPMEGLGIAKNQEEPKIMHERYKNHLSKFENPDEVVVYNNLFDDGETPYHRFMSYLIDYSKLAIFFTIGFKRYTITRSNTKQHLKIYRGCMVSGLVFMSWTSYMKDPRNQPTRIEFPILSVQEQTVNPMQRSTSIGTDLPSWRKEYLRYSDEDRKRVFKDEIILNEIIRNKSLKDKGFKSYIFQFVRRLEF